MTPTTTGISQITAHAEPYAGPRRLIPKTPLATLRALSGLSVAALARAADLDRSTVDRLERGIGQPQRRTASRLAAVLSVNAEVLFPDLAPTNDERRPAATPNASQNSGGRARHGTE